MITIGKVAAKIADENGPVLTDTIDDADTAGQLLLM